MKKTAKPPVVVRPAIIADVLAAAHLSHWVVSPYPERGGIFFVSYPQQLKSTLIKTLKKFPDVVVLSDINVQQMAQMREIICTGRVRTVGFDEFNKLYQRSQATAANLEGVIMAVVSQGWTGPSFQDQRATTDEVRCLIVGGLTRTVYENRLTEWRGSGFAQRFLWVFYKLRNPFAIGDAIERQSRFSIVSEPWGHLDGPIAMNVSNAEKKEIRSWLQKQEGLDGTPYSLMLKIATVLKWHYRAVGGRNGEHRHMDVLREFSLLLGSEYGLVDFDGQETE